MIKDHGCITEIEVKKIEDEISKIKPLSKKVFILRNNLFGHKSNASNNDEIWKEAEVTPNEFRQLIDETKEILNQLTSIWDRSDHSFNLSSKEDTIKLLEDLKKFNEECL